MLRKTANTDPNGGWAPLVQTTGDFQLTVQTKRLAFNSSANANRYSLTDGGGNGYGLYLNFNDGKLYLEKRALWSSTILGTAAPVGSGITAGQWYTLRLIRAGSSLTAEAYIGKAYPGLDSPAAIVTAADGTYGGFTQVNVNGGYDYDTDDVRVTTPSSEAATGYLLKYATKYIVDDGTTPGMGESRFSDAVTGEGLGIPKSPGSQECYRVNVKNIVSGNDRTPNSQFFFSLKSEDENHNLSPMSNVAKGVTALSSLVYNMVSVPKVPNPDTPAGVFGDDVGSPLYLYRWDSRGVGHERGCYDGLPNPYNPNNEVPACTQLTATQEGSGYFLWSPRLDVVLDAPAGSTDVAATSCTGELGQSFQCYVFPLQEGWNMTGNPFGKEVDVSAMKVRRSVQPPGQSPVGTTMTFQGAVAAGWIGTGGIYTYNGTNYTYDVCDALVCNPVLQPWKGYWVWLGTSAVNTTYDLLIPLP
jgi:hypothetical protein